MEHSFPVIHLFGIQALELNVTVAIMTVLASLIVMLLALAAVRKLDLRRPSGMQNFMEFIVDFIRGLAKDTIGEKHADAYVPLGVTLILWMFISNQMGLITNFQTSGVDLPALGIKSSEHVAWFMSPTASITTAMTMGITMVLFSHVVGLRHPGHYFKHLVTPAWMLPIHLIEEIPKFLTLGLRLFGNIFAGEVLIGILVTIPNALGFGIGHVVGAIPLFAWLAYSLFVGTIQAFVFTVLTLVYIGQKIPQEGH